MIKQVFAALSAVCLSVAAHANVIPVGLQSNISAATVAGWGFSTCASASGSQNNVLVSTILNSCQGDYVAMAIRDTRTNTYLIFGAGEHDTVTRAVYDDYAGDDNTGLLNNWSNGLNFYRTANTGSWGFTTIDRTNLNSADILLLDGINDFGAQHTGASETNVQAAGLSFHLYSFNNNTFFAAGWGYNVTGHNFADTYPDYLQREFLIAAAPQNSLPEPGSLAAVAVALFAVGAARRRRH